MCISDWSSDVCSSDLTQANGECGDVLPECRVGRRCRNDVGHVSVGTQIVFTVFHRHVGESVAEVVGKRRPCRVGKRGAVRAGERKRVVKGKSVSVRLALGGGRIIKKKKKKRII